MTKPVIKEQKYTTVIVNHDTNTVVRASEGYSKSVLEKFHKQHTPEQLSSIKVVTGDGSKWITEFVNEYTPDCARRVDSFHVAEWAMIVLDEVRKNIWHDAYVNISWSKKIIHVVKVVLKRMILNLLLLKLQKLRQMREKYLLTHGEKLQSISVKSNNCVLI